MKENQLVSELINIEDHEMYTNKFGNLKSFRKIEKDGNCMYLSIGVQLIEFVRSNPEFKFRWEEFISKSEEYFETMKLEKFTYCDYVDTIKILVDNDEKIEAIDKHSLYEVIYFLRLVISAEMRINKQKYEPFLVDINIEEYCKRNVEPFFAEAGYIEIGALVEILPLNIRVVDIQEKTEDCTRLYGVHSDSLNILHTPNHFEPCYY